MSTSLSSLADLHPYCSPLTKCIHKPFENKVHSQYQAWMVNGLFTYTPSGEKRAPRKELVLQWIHKAWQEIPADLVANSFKSCKNFERYGWHQGWSCVGRRRSWSWWSRRRVRERVRHGQRAGRLAETRRTTTTTTTALFRATPVLFRTTKSIKVNDQQQVSFSCVF